MPNDVEFVVTKVPCAAFWPYERRTMRGETWSSEAGGHAISVAFIAAHAEAICRPGLRSSATLEEGILTGSGNAEMFGQTSKPTQ